MTTDLLPPPAPHGSTPAAPPRSPVPPTRGGGPGRMVAYVVCGVIAIATLLGGVYSLADLSAKSATSDEWTYPAAERPIDTLVVRTDGDVTVIGAAPGSDTTVQRHVQYGLREPSTSAQYSLSNCGAEQTCACPPGRDCAADPLHTGRLELNGDCPSGSGVWCHVDYTVTVASDAVLLLDTGAGAIRVTGIDGDVTATTEAGSVKVFDVGGVLRLTTGAGPVRGEDVRSTDVEGRSDAGSVRLFFDVAPTRVVADTGAGGVEVVVPDTGESYRVEADTEAGSTDLAVPTDPDGERSIEAHSEAGSVEVRHPR